MKATRLYPLPEALVVARMIMIRRDPWYGMWVMGCRVFSVPDGPNGSGCLATDESLRLYISPAMMTLPPAKLAWLLRHEADHWIHKHFEDREALIYKLMEAGAAPDKAKDLWNMAADTPINRGIGESWRSDQAMRTLASGLSEHPTLWDDLAATGVVGQCCTPDSMAKWFEDDRLKQDLPTAGIVDILCEKLRQAQQGQGQGQGQPGQGSGQPSSGSAGSPQQGQGQGQGAPTTGPEGISSGCAEDLPYQADDPSPLSASDLQEVYDGILDAVAEAADGSGRGHRHVPNSLRQLVRVRAEQRTAASKVDWSAILESDLSDAVRRVESGGVRYLYSEPEPIKLGGGLLLAGRMYSAPEILLVCDVSGSMYSYLPSVMAQIETAAQRVGGRVLLATGDTEMLSFGEYTDGDDIGLSAQGGTSMERVVPQAVREARAQAHDPVATVLVTDGETGYPDQGDMDGCSLHVILVKNSPYYNDRVPAWACKYEAWE